ncbi:hypothetical protein GcM1_182015 [Golovinomyces cichoracearum]|uniref:Uncharacterized protein n=1 Tax=Golovinomyces cichoracearum TaxID=62708 RepID=A0A420J3Y8_9PEZI|nr:hypothetical protein GcM1_182015 [Golovinomyces cichoracearum]
MADEAIYSGTLFEHRQAALLVQMITGSRFRVAKLVSIDDVSVIVFLPPTTVSTTKPAMAKLTKSSSTDT